MDKISISPLSIPKSSEEFDYYDEMNFGFKTWHERWNDWLKWRETKEGKRDFEKKSKEWLKKYGN